MHRRRESESAAMLEVMLNVTTAELDRIGGDFTYYRSLVKARSPGITFRLLEDSWIRTLWWHCGRVYGKLYGSEPLRRGLPIRFRQRLRLNYLCAPVSPRSFSERFPAVIYSHILFPQVPAEVRVPIVWSSQGLVPDYYAYFGRHRLEDAIYTVKRLGALADVLHIWTRYGAENIRQYCPELGSKLFVIPPFVDVAPVSDIAHKLRDTVRFLFIGREAERKGLLDVISAFEMLASKYKNIELIVVSKLGPSLFDRLSRLRKTRCYEGIATTELHRLLEEASVLIVPTYADAYNLVLVEGMAKGCAIITSNLGALREVAPNGEVGFLVQPGNVGEIVQKASLLIEREDLRLGMAEAGVRRYQMYHSETAVLPKLYEVFRLVAEQRYVSA